MQEASATWRRRSMPMLGTYVEIAVPAADDAQLREWTEPAFARVAACHAAMSFHSAESDLAAIARAVAGDRLPLRHETWATLQAALDIESASDGLFNVAVASELVDRGVLPLPTGVGARPLATSALAALRLEPGDVVCLRETVWIDLGGIAKGAAVDAAIDALHAAGAPAALVNAGGDLRAFGADAHTVWIRHPAEPGGLLAVASLSDGAFATSGALDPSGRRHIVGPSPAWFSASVAAPTCLVADALTKVALLAGPAAARPILHRYDAHAVWIDMHGQPHHA